MSLSALLISTWATHSCGVVTTRYFVDKEEAMFDVQPSSRRPLPDVNQISRDMTDGDILKVHALGAVQIWSSEASENEGHSTL